jgi:hypothetical protein
VERRFAPLRGRGRRGRHRGGDGDEDAGVEVDPLDERAAAYEARATAGLDGDGADGGIRGEHHREGRRIEAAVDGGAWTSR